VPDNLKCSIIAMIVLDWRARIAPSSRLRETVLDLEGRSSGLLHDRSSSSDLVKDLYAASWLSAMTHCGAEASQVNTREEGALDRTLGDKLANSWLGRISKAAMSAVELRILVHHKKYGQEPAARGLRKIWKSERTILFSPAEIWILRELARAQKYHGGCFAEVGVFRGVSAEVICQAKLPDTEFYLFDTFEGLPSPGEIDPRFKERMFSASDQVVRARLKGYSRWTIFKGLFPGTARPVENSRFSFVHLDVDLYDSTLAGLEFFWPRMLKGGILISHDYSQCEGVHQAFKDFFQNPKSCRLVELPTTQIMVIKD
jgi:O-methyltransferase